MRAVAVDFDLRKEREGHAVVQLAERFDLFVATGLLVAELIAWKAEDFQAFAVVFRVEALQALVLRREAALAGGVDDEQDLAAIVTETLVVAVVEFGGEVVDLHS
jgi:hypothetical protein